MLAYTKTLRLVYLQPAKKTMKEKNKTLVIQGVPTEFADDKFKESLDLNKIQYAKAESMKTGETAGRSKCFN